MDIRRTIFWISFIVVLGLIVWGLAVAMDREAEKTSGSVMPAPISSTDNVRGPENAPVTLIEYSDFQCPACALYAPIIDRLLVEASTTVRFAYRHFPLQYHRHALPSAHASEAAGLQGRFWEMSGLIFENQRVWEGLTTTQPEQIFRGYAESLGLDMDVYDRDVASPEIRQKVQDQLREGVSIGINFTPSFFVNGKLVQPNSYEEFKTIIDSAITGSTY